MKTAETILNNKKAPDLVAVSEDTTILETVTLMVKHKIGAMLIKRGEEIVGIWTERDLLRNTLEPGFDPKTALIKDYMQTDLKCEPYNTPIIKLEETFLGLYIRHILIKKGEKYVGMLSIGDVLRASLLSKEEKIKDLNKIASWEYYENWSRSPKTKPLK